MREQLSRVNREGRDKYLKSSSHFFSFSCFLRASAVCPSLCLGVHTAHAVRSIDRSNEDRGGEDAAREVFEVCNRARYQIPLYVAREAVALENQIDSKCKVVYYCCFKVVSYMIIL